MKQNNWISKNILKIVCIFIIVFLSLYHFKDFQQIHITNDEFGYWGIAAFFAGKDWRGLLENVPYYSYGYSLLLTPLFWLFSNASYMYQTAIILNIILLCLTFFLAIQCGKKLFPNIKEWMLVLISFTIALYSNTSVQVHIAWTETLLYFLFWLLFYLAIQLVQKVNYTTITVFSITIVYTYAVHQRAIGIIIAGVIFIVLLKIEKKINWKQFSLFLTMFIIVFGLHIIMKNYLLQNFWNLNAVASVQTVQTVTSDVVKMNDYVGQMDKVRAVTQINGFLLLLYSIVGKLFYIMVATLMIGFFGLVNIIQRIVKLVEILIKEKKIKVEDNLEVYLFLGLSFAASFMINALYMYNPSRLDMIVYGRYMEFVFGPLLLCGFTTIYIKKNLVIQHLILVMVLVLFAWMVNQKFIELNGTPFNPICAVGICRLMRGAENVSNLSFRLACICMIGSSISIAISLLTKEKLRKLYMIVVASCCIGFWGLNSYEILVKNIIISQQFYSDNIKSIASTIQTEANGANIYYLQEDRTISSQDYTNTNIERMQFILYDTTIHRIDYNQTYRNNKEVEGAVYIALKNSNIYEQVKKEYHMMDESEIFGLFTTN